MHTTLYFQMLTPALGCATEEGTVAWIVDHFRKRLLLGGLREFVFIFITFPVILRHFAAVFCFLLAVFRKVIANCTVHLFGSWARRF